MQRVAIGRALVRRPKAILMDEPIGALDAKLREDMRTELKRLHIENKATSVYVTHDQVEAMSLADRIVVMNEGILQQVGTPMDVYQNPGQSLRRAVHRQSGDEHRRGEARRGGRTRPSVRLGDAGRGLRDSRRRCRAGSAAAAARGDLSLGIRPEGVIVAHEPAGGFVPLEAHLIEPLGAYDIVDLKVGYDDAAGADAVPASSRKPGEPSSRVSTRRRPISSTRKSGRSLGIRLGA